MLGVATIAHSTHYRAASQTWKAVRAGVEAVGSTKAQDCSHSEEMDGTNAQALAFWPWLKKPQTCICIKYSSTCTRKPPPSPAVAPPLHFRASFPGFPEHTRLWTLCWAHLMRIDAECTFPDSTTQATHNTFPVFNQKEARIPFCTLLWRDGIASCRKSCLYWLAQPGVKSWASLIQIHPGCLWYLNDAAVFATGHLKHHHREQKGVVRGLLRAKPSLSTHSSVNTIESMPVISGINLDPNASALLSYLKGNCINLLHSGCGCEGWAVCVSLDTSEADPGLSQDPLRSLLMLWDSSQALWGCSKCSWTPSSTSAGICCLYARNIDQHHLYIQPTTRGHSTSSHSLHGASISCHLLTWPSHRIGLLLSRHRFQDVYKPSVCHRAGLCQQNWGHGCLCLSEPHGEAAGSDSLPWELH